MNKKPAGGGRLNVVCVAEVSGAAVGDARGYVGESLSATSPAAPAGASMAHLNKGVRKVSVSKLRTDLLCEPPRPNDVVDREPTVKRHRQKRHRKTVGPVEDRPSYWVDPASRARTRARRPTEAEGIFLAWMVATGRGVPKEGDASAGVRAALERLEELAGAGHWGDREADVLLEELVESGAATMAQLRPVRRALGWVLARFPGGEIVATP